MSAARGWVRGAPGRRAVAAAAGAWVVAATVAAAPAVPAAAARTAGARTAATPPPAPERDPWRTARGLADAAQYDSALAVLRDGIARGGDPVALRWLEAGITGEAGRHREAVALYERMAADHPDRAADFGADLAAQRLLAGDAAGAARGFRAWLAIHPEDDGARRGLALSLARADSLPRALALYDSLVAGAPDDVDLALDRARVLGWMGRHGDAIAAYRRVLALEPGHAGARLGLAMNQNWSGRHRRAARGLEALAGESGADPEATKALAFARYWDDDPDGARRAIEHYLGRVPDDAEAAGLRRTIVREHRPTLRGFAGRADDSDGLRINTTGMELWFPIAARTAAFAGWRRDNLRDRGGTDDPLRVTGGIRHRFNPVWSITGAYTHTEWSDSLGLAEGGEGGIVFRPADRVRLEVAVAREPVLTRIAADLGITLLSYVAAVDLQPAERLAFHADGRLGLYSDDNWTERVSTSARWTVHQERRGTIALLFGMDQLNARRDLDHGYYDPDFHREWGPGADLEWRPQDHLMLGVTGRFGWQREKGSDAESFYSHTGRAQAILGEVWTLAIEGGRGDSSLQADAGYERTWWRASIARGF